MNSFAGFRACCVGWLLLATSVSRAWAEGDTNPLARIEAAVAEWQKDGSLAPLLPLLIESRNSKDERVRGAANEALEAIGPDVPAVMTWVIEQAQRQNNVNPMAETQMAEALAKLGLEAVPAMLKAAVVDHVAQRQQRSQNYGGAFGTTQRLQKVFAIALSKQDDAALPTLLAMLRDPTHMVRSIAAETLRLWGDRAKPALPMLLAALDDRDGDVRLRALGAVMALAGSEPAAQEALCVVIRDHRDAVLRQTAITQLQQPASKRLLTESMLAAVRVALADPQSSIRLAAAGLLLDQPDHREFAQQVIRHDCGAREFNVRQQALGLLRQHKGIDKAFARTQAVRALADEGYSVRVAALEVLRSVGLDAESKPRLLEMMSDEEPQVRTAAAGVLWDAGDQVAAAKVWLSQLKTPNSQEYYGAQSRLQQLRSIPDDVEPLLVEALGSTQMEVRRAVLPALLKRQTLSEASLAMIQKLATDADASIRSQALQALRTRNVSKDVRLKLAMTGLADAELSVRLQSVAQLMELGTASKPAVPKLLEMLKDAKEAGPVRQAILRGLPQLGAAPETLIPELTALLKDNDSQIVTLAITTLGTLGPQAIPHLTPLLEHNSSVVRTAASRALAPLTTQGSGLATKLVPGMLAQYAKATEAEKIQLRTQLRQLKPDGVKVLTGELRSPDVATRRLVAETLRQMSGAGSQLAEKELTEALEDDDLAVRLNAALALAARPARGPGALSPRVVAIHLEGATSSDAEFRLLVAQHPPVRDFNRELAAAMKEILKDKEIEAVAGAARYLLSHREFEAVRPVLPKLIETLGTGTPAGNAVFSAMPLLQPIAKDVAPLLADRLKEMKGQVSPNDYQVFNALQVLGKEATPALKAAWPGADTQRQFMIMNAMRNAGPDIVPVLIEMVSTSDSKGAAVLYPAIGQYASRSPDAMTFLLAKLDDPDLAKAAAAASAFSSSSNLPETVVPPLLRVLQAVLVANEAGQRDADGRRVEPTSILWALARAGAHARPALETMTTMMNDTRPDNAFWRSSAAAAIVEIDPNHPHVAATLASIGTGQNESGAVNAMQALIKLGPRARPVLLKLEAALPEIPDNLRGHLVFILALCESESPKLIEVIEADLGSTSGSRHNTMEAIKVLGPKAKSLAPKLLALLDQSNSSGLKRDVVAALGRVDRESPEVVERLGKLLDSDRTLREMTLLALADHGEQAKPAAAAVEAVWAGDPTHRILAAAVLVLMNADAKSRVAPTLLATLEPGNIRTPQLATSDALARLGRESEDVRKNLQAALRNNYLPIRVCAARAIWKIEQQSETVLPVLIEALKQPGVNQYGHIESARTLADIGPPGKEAAPHLLRLVNAATGDQQMLYLRALKKVDPAAAADAGFR